MLDEILSVLIASYEQMLRMRCFNAEALCRDPTANLDDLREAVAKLEDTERIARRVFGGTHPDTVGIGAAKGEAVRTALKYFERWRRMGWTFELGDSGGWTAVRLDE